MNVGIVHPFFDLLGGAEQTTKHMVQGLGNCGYDITLYTVTDLCVDIGSNIKHIKKRLFPSNKILFKIYNINHVFKMIKDKDVIILSSGDLSLPSIPFKKDLIVYCHSTFEFEFKNKNNNTYSKRYLYKKLINNHINKRISLLNAPHFTYIANSTYTKNKLKELFGIDSKVIYPPVHYTPTNNTHRTGIVTIARYSPEKNLEFNIQVMKDTQLANNTYQIIGNLNILYQQKYFDELKEMSKHHSHIHLLINNSREQLEEKLNSAKVYFSTSKETFGISVVESIIAGCIPIVPDNTANIETVPIPELRYPENNIDIAREKIKCAISGDYNKYIPKLKEHIKQFTSDNFIKNIDNYIKNYVNAKEVILN